MTTVYRTRPIIRLQFMLMMKAGNIPILLSSQKNGKIYGQMFSAPKNTLKSVLRTLRDSGITHYEAVKGSMIRVYGVPKGFSPPTPLSAVSGLMYFNSKNGSVDFDFEITEFKPTSGSDLSAEQIISIRYRPIENYKLFR